MVVTNGTTTVEQSLHAMKRIHGRDGLKGAAPTTGGTTNGTTGAASGTTTVGTTSGPAATGTTATTAAGTTGATTGGRNTTSLQHANADNGES